MQSAQFPGSLQGLSVACFSQAIEPPSTGTDFDESGIAFPSNPVFSATVIHFGESYRAHWIDLVVVIGGDPLFGKRLFTPTA